MGWGCRAPPPELNSNLCGKKDTPLLNPGPQSGSLCSEKIQVDIFCNGYEREQKGERPERDGPKMLLLN